MQPDTPHTPESRWAQLALSPFWMRAFALLVSALLVVLVQTLMGAQTLQAKVVRVLAIQLVEQVFVMPLAAAAEF
jgi:hypothetical protein